MDQQEQGFLTAALSVGDERLERRLLVGYYLIRDCCRLADDPIFVPRTRVAREAFEEVIAEGVLLSGEELQALEGLLTSLDAQGMRRSVVFAALTTYGIALYREGSLSAATVVFEVLDRLWTPECDPGDRLEAAYYQGLVLIRGPNALRTTDVVPIVLALRARTLRDFDYLGLAKALGLNRKLLAGNLPQTIRYAERLLNWSYQHRSKRVEGWALNTLAVCNGRAGHFDQVLRWSILGLSPEFHSSVQLSCLNAMGHALMDLHQTASARAAFELLLLAPTAQSRRLGWIGLMDLHARLGETREFEACYQRMVNQPLMASSRIHFLQTAGRGWAKLGELDRARRAYDQAYTLARALGYGYEIIETEDQMAQLPDPEQVARAADIAPQVAARLTALRDLHAEEIAACMA